MMRTLSTKNLFLLLSLVLVACELQQTNDTIEVDYVLPVASMHQRLQSRLGAEYTGIDSVRLVSATRADLNQLFVATAQRRLQQDTAISFSMTKSESVVLQFKWYANGMRVATFIDTLNDEGLSTNPRISFAIIQEIPEKPLGVFIDSVFSIYDGAAKGIQVARDIFSTDSNGVSLVILGGNEDSLFKVEGFNLLLAAPARLAGTLPSERKLQIEAKLRSRSVTDEIVVNLMPHPYLTRQGDSLVLLYQVENVTELQDLSISLKNSTEVVMQNGALLVDSKALYNLSPLMLRLTAPATANEQFDWSILGTDTSDVDFAIQSPNPRFIF